MDEVRRIACGVDWITLTWQPFISASYSRGEGPREAVGGASLDGGEHSPGLPGSVHAYLEELQKQAELNKALKKPAPVVGLEDGVLYQLGRARYPYVHLLRALDGSLTLTVAPLGAPKGTPCIRAEGEGLPLWEVGHQRWVERARRAAATLATDPETGETVELVHERLSRVDLACDLQGWALDGSDVERRCFVTRATPHWNGRGAQETDPIPVQMHGQGKGFTGYEFGRGGAPLRARVYDKTEKNRLDGKSWLEEHWKKSPHYLPGERVWRVELQFRREILKDFGIKGWNPEKLDGIWRAAVG